MYIYFILKKPWLKHFKKLSQKHFTAKPEKSSFLVSIEFFSAEGIFNSRQISDTDNPESYTIESHMGDTSFYQMLRYILTRHTL